MFELNKRINFVNKSTQNKTGNSPDEFGFEWNLVELDSKKLQLNLHYVEYRSRGNFLSKILKGSVEIWHLN